MDLKLQVFCVLVGLVCIMERSSVLGDRNIQGEVGSILLNAKVNSLSTDIAPIIHNECGGLLTEAPGKIVLKLQKSTPNKEHHCVWTLHAPINNRSFIRQIKINRSLYDENGLSTADITDVNDHPVIKVYDGVDIDNSKVLFGASPSSPSLDACISSNQDLTISYKHVLGPKVNKVEIAIDYGFAPESLLSN